MKTADFDYDLPQELIAQRPAPRGTSRLLVLDAEGEERHRRVADLPSLLRPRDLLVVNDTRVIPARIFARRRPGGGRSELLLLEKLGPSAWEAMARPAKRLREGSVLDVEGAEVVLEIERKARTADGVRFVVRFSEEIESHLGEVGHVPLPPYIQRPDEAADRETYQTVFARHDGAVAAPTAGLHFDAELLARLEERGVERARVTLHVGPGTFRPVNAEEVEEHRMDEERYAVPEATAEAVRRCRERGGRVVAVGTTVVRTLESTGKEDRTIEAGAGRTSLFLRPGNGPRIVDVLLTNFHLPRSTLIMLVASFAGRERVLQAYAEAVERGYRFYSYGDAMLVKRRDSIEDAVADSSTKAGTK